MDWKVPCLKYSERNILSLKHYIDNKPALTPVPASPGGPGFPASPGSPYKEQK